MKVTIDEVAKLAGCSKGTVSRVLNEKGYVSEETREKVHKAAKELNYYPSEVARSVSSKKTFLIGLIIPTTNHPFFGELVHFIERNLNRYGYKLMICNTLNDVEKEEKYVTKLMSNQVDGMIVASQNSIKVDYNFPGLPIIAIDHFISNAIPVIRSDNYKGGDLATNELINAGCKEILCVNQVKDHDGNTNLRSKAYEDVMIKHKLNRCFISLRSHLTKEERTLKIKKELLENSMINGVFAQDDETAVLFLDILNDLGKHNVKVIGYDGSSMSRLLRPDLSTIQQPIEDLAYEAIKILLKLINKEVVNQKEYILPVALLKGETTKS